MERTASFSSLAGVTIVSSEMFQNRPPPLASTEPTIHFSERDRQDAARLLTLILGEEGARRARLCPNPAAVAEALLEDRKRRARIFNSGMFGEPAWDILLTLYVMDKSGPRLTIGRLTQMVGYAPTTVLRWLEYLDDQELIRRQEHPGDARTSFITLTDKARNALTLYLSELQTSRL